jgi:hypothetical protein
VEIKNKKGGQASFLLSVSRLLIPRRSSIVLIAATTNRAAKNSCGNWATTSARVNLKPPPNYPPVAFAHPDFVDAIPRTKALALRALVTF